MQCGCYSGQNQSQLVFFFFFFNDTATTEIYTLSLHDALPIWRRKPRNDCRATRPRPAYCEALDCLVVQPKRRTRPCRSEEHTSELQSHLNLVCRLLLEKKKL